MRNKERDFYINADMILLLLHSNCLSNATICSKLFYFSTKLQKKVLRETKWKIGFNFLCARRVNLDLSSLIELWRIASAIWRLFIFRGLFLILSY